MVVLCYFIFVNPHCNETVLGGVLLLVCFFCLSVSQHLISQASNQAINNLCIRRHMNVKYFVGICLKQLWRRVLLTHKCKSQYTLYSDLYTCGQFSPLDSYHCGIDYQEFIQPCQKRCLLAQLTCVELKTDSTIHIATMYGVANPCAGTMV